MFYDNIVILTSVDHNTYESHQSFISVFVAVFFLIAYFILLYYSIALIRSAYPYKGPSSLELKSTKVPLGSSNTFALNIGIRDNIFEVAGFLILFLLAFNVQLLASHSLPLSLKTALYSGFIGVFLSGIVLAFISYVKHSSL